MDKREITGRISPGRSRRMTPGWWAACPAAAARSPRTLGWPSPTVSDRGSPPARRTLASRLDGNSNSPALSYICGRQRVTTELVSIVRYRHLFIINNLFNVSRIIANRRLDKYSRNRL